MGKYNNRKPSITPPDYTKIISAYAVEADVVGYMIGNSSKYREAIMCGVTQDCFYDPKHRVIFATIQRLVDENNVEPTKAAVCDIIRNFKIDWIRDVEIDYLVNSIIKARDAVDLKTSVEVLKQYALARQMTTFAQRITNELNDGGGFVSEDVLQKADELLTTIKRDYIPGKMEKFTRPITEQELWGELQNANEGIETFIEVHPQGDPDGEKEKLVIPIGQLSFVCALPSHGKSIMLQNLALFIADHRAGDVLYFTREENRERTMKQLLNCHMNLTLSKNNRRSINSVYSSANGIVMIQREVQNAFDIEQQKFWEDYILNGKLRVYDDDLDCDELCSVIQLAARKGNISGVFIDYVQKIYINGWKSERNKELKAICERLNKVAKETNLPIVLAAQLNREAKSPLEMFSQNVADSADIEREANLMILMWKGTARPLNGSKMKETDLPELSLGAGGVGKLYIRLAKNRDATQDAEAILDIDYNRGYISGLRDGESKPSNPFAF